MKVFGRARFLAAAAGLIVVLLAPVGGASASAAPSDAGFDWTDASAAKARISSLWASRPATPAPGGRASASSTASSTHSIDETDTEADVSDSRGDILGYGASKPSGDKVYLNIELANPPSPSSAPWIYDDTFLVYVIDSGSDGEDDRYAIVFAQNSAWQTILLSRWGDYYCVGDTNVVGSSLETWFTTACLANPGNITIAAALQFNISGLAGYDDTDFAPDAGYVGPMTTGTGSYAADAYGIMGDAFGGIHGVGVMAYELDEPDLVPYWPDWDIGRGARFVHDYSGERPQTGFSADAFGGVHPMATAFYEPPPPVVGTGYWPGWDIVRGFTLLPDNTGGYVLDAWGGLHPFAVEGYPMPPEVTAGPYWPGWDIARGVTMRPDGGGGYIVDGWGGLHPFAIGGNELPPKVNTGPYWPGWNVVRGVSSVQGGGGYVVDAWGGTHPYGTVDSLPPSAIDPADAPYWPGWDIVRGIGLD